ncbi:polysaccharide biosynthesis/export family protein [Croceibacterium sp. TMG7-5b_MA50]|uniref:polysaccharide biosynthesis/export family protein n=1 Tax=Croceibacterium sp. TMG7-5b_MA50 TaxID=3121290 RepID=UPI00322145E5
MLRDLRFILSALGCVTVLGACQPQLNSGLPLGAPAYEALGGAVPVTEGVYRIRPGDRVNVSLFQEPDLSGTDLLVDESGQVSLPLIGAVQMAGRTTEEVSREIERAYGARYLRDPQASVALRTIVPQTVTVDGQVTQPGVFEIRPGYTLVSAIALARGTTNTAKFDEVLIMRTIDGRRAVARFDINAIRAGRMEDPRILPGDQVVVGFDRLRGIYRDVLQVGPLLGVFTQL